MIKRFDFLFVASTLFVAAAMADAPAPMAIIDRIAGPDGGYDYMSVDSERRRLYVARTKGVMTVGLTNGAITPLLVEGNDISAVTIIPGTDLMLSTEYYGGGVVIFNRDTGEVRARIKTGKNPDAAVYDPGSKLVFVMNGGSHNIAVLDVAAAKVVGRIGLRGTPEGGVADGQGKLYVNIEETGQIAVVDIATRKLARYFDMPGCKEPTGIALDTVSKTLISACHNGVVKLVDVNTGADKGNVAVGKDADGALFDAGGRQAIVPCNDGTLWIFALDEQGKPGIAQTVVTQPGARTIARDAASGRLYLAAHEIDAAEKPVPGTFKVLVVAPLPAGRTRVVCVTTAEGCEHSGAGGIQSAIDSALDGDTVFIKAGRYIPSAWRDVPHKKVAVRGFVLIDGKQLDIVAEPGAVLDGSTGAQTTAIVLRNADVAVRNLEITGFRYAIEEDKIYDGHGIYAIDSRLRLDDVTISKFQKMGVTGAGNSTLAIAGLKLLDGHVGIWLRDSAHLRLTRSLLRGNDSSAIAAYDNTAAHVSASEFRDNKDDGIYTEQQAVVFITTSTIANNSPTGVNATENSRIWIGTSTLSGNGKNTASKDKGEILLGPDVIQEAGAPPSTPR